MLSPKNQKYRKSQKGRVPSISKSGTTIAFGSFGLRSLGRDRINSRQIEAARRSAVRHMKRLGKFWIRVFPDLPISKKPAEVRMGKGKGSTEFFAVRVSHGRILFEVDGVEDSVAIRALELASAKLSIKTKIVRSYD